MITFTPLSGGAYSTKATTPLAYLLQIDDVNILLDCGSPDWAQEPSPFVDPNSTGAKEEEGEGEKQGSEVEDGATPSKDGRPPWKEYCEKLEKLAPSIDLVLFSHGDLSHCGLYPWAYARWGLKAPAYTTLPVQSVGRIAVTEDVEGLRDEEDFGDEPRDNAEAVGDEDGDEDGPADVEMQAEGEDGAELQNGRAMESGSPKKSKAKQTMNSHGKCIATVIEVQDAFDAINTLRYSQPTHLQGKCQGLTITAFNAGHTIGGAIWKIRSPSSGTIVYAVNLNHMKERHLDGTVLISGASGTGISEVLARPDLLITDAERASVVTSRRKDRDAALIDTITATLGSRSSLFLPCDSSTRILELLVLLDQHWNYSKLKYPICLLSRTSKDMLAFVRSMMEWLGGTISKEDVGEDGTGGGRHKRNRDDDNDEDSLGPMALRFRHVEFFPNPQALMQTYSSKDPKLIIAVPASLSHGPSRHLFAEFSRSPDNVLLLTSRGEPGTLGRALFDEWNNAQRPEDKWDKGKIGRNVMLDKSIKLKLNSKVPLQGAELEAYQAELKAKKEKEQQQKAALARNQRMLEADEGDEDSESESESEDEDEGRGDGDEMDTRGDAEEAGGGRGKRRRVDGDLGNADWLDGDEGLPKQLLSFDIYLKGNVSKATSFFKSAGQTQRFRMFPYVEKKKRVDDYGETIDVGMWLRKGKALEEEAESEELKFQRKALAEEEARKAALQVPSKYVSEEIEIALACRLLFIDLEGLNDGRAVKTIVPQVNPRKMIIVQAHPAATDQLIESCMNIRTMTRDIYAPKVGDSIQIGHQTSTFSINISDELLATLKRSQFEDNEIAYVRGRVVGHATSTIPTLEPVLSSTLQVPEVTARGPRMLGSRAKAPLPNSTMIGELKLTALKARLANVGVQAELIGEGVLVCGVRPPGSDEMEGTVAVRKVGKGKVELEGSVNEVYYTVRREIYELHARVATC